MLPSPFSDLTSHITFSERSVSLSQPLMPTRITLSPIMFSFGLSPSKHLSLSEMTLMACFHGCHPPEAKPHETLPEKFSTVASSPSPRVIHHRRVWWTHRPGHTGAGPKSHLGLGFHLSGSHLPAASQSTPDLDTTCALLFTDQTSVNSTKPTEPNQGQPSGRWMTQPGGTALAQVNGLCHCLLWPLAM